MGKFIAYCSYYDSHESDVLRERSRECITEEEAQSALVELMDVVSDCSLLDECDVFEKEYCVFDGSVWRPTDMAFVQRDGAILYNERLRMIEAYKVRFISFNKKNGLWFAHVSEHPGEQRRMDSDCAVILDYLAGSGNRDSMALVIAGEYPNEYDDFKLRLAKIHQDESGATYKVINGHYFLLDDLLNKAVRINYLPSTLFNGYPPHIDILEVRCD